MYDRVMSTSVKHGVTWDWGNGSFVTNESTNYNQQDFGGAYVESETSSGSTRSGGLTMGVSVGGKQVFHEDTENWWKAMETRAGMLSGKTMDITPHNETMMVGNKYVGPDRLNDPKGWQIDDAERVDGIGNDDFECLKYKLTSSEHIGYTSDKIFPGDTTTYPSSKGSRGYTKSGPSWFDERNQEVNSDILASTTRTKSNKNSGRFNFS
jgi:hypothetical protein